MERASFSGHLKQQSSQTGEVRVSYEHDLRCNVKVFLEHSTDNAIGWKINVQGHSGVVNTIKKEICAHTVSYLQQRLKKQLPQITFDDIKMLASTRVIRSVRRR